MSSSLGSMRLLSQFAPHEFAERGIDIGAYRQHPMPFVREVAAFYRILLRHHDALGILELEIGALEGMMIGKGMLGELEPQPAQVLKEALRAADPGDRMHLATLKVVRSDSPIAIAEVMELAAGECHGVRLRRNARDTYARRFAHVDHD